MSKVDSQNASRRRLDGPAARLVALAVLAGVVALLGYVHRERIFPPDPAAVASEDPAALCLAERAADIDGMVAEGAITKEQASLFKSRAEALCQAQAGNTGAPPPLPAN